MKAKAWAFWTFSCVAVAGALFLTVASAGDETSLRVLVVVLGLDLTGRTALDAQARWYAARANRGTVQRRSRLDY